MFAKLKPRRQSRTPVVRKHALRGLERDDLAQVNGGFELVSIVVGGAIVYGVGQLRRYLKEIPNS